MTKKGGSTVEFQRCFWVGPKNKTVNSELIMFVENGQNLNNRDNLMRKLYINNGEDYEEVGIVATISSGVNLDNSSFYDDNSAEATNFKNGNRVILRRIFDINDGEVDDYQTYTNGTIYYVENEQLGGKKRRKTINRRKNKKRRNKSRRRR